MTVEVCPTCGSNKRWVFNNERGCWGEPPEAGFDPWHSSKRLVEDTEDIPNEHEVKQVLLIRRDLGMRRGKEIAQGAHASIAFLTNAIHWMGGSPQDGVPSGLHLTPAAWQWINGQFTKVTLQVHSEEELLEYYNKAKAAGLTAHIIKDSGRTEFDGVPTYTTCAIGPNFADEIDPITRDLRLY
jgi:PTH2 family peptidyl-tRNA hydrolase